MTGRIVVDADCKDTNEWLLSSELSLAGRPMQKETFLHGLGAVHPLGDGMGGRRTAKCHSSEESFGGTAGPHLAGGRLGGDECPRKLAKNDRKEIGELPLQKDLVLYESVLPDEDIGVPHVVAT
jgi:hypothetical protein